MNNANPNIGPVEMYKYLEENVTLWNKPSPIIIGVSGPQGSGKSFAVNHALQYLSEKLGKVVVPISLDDVYLTYAEQTQLTNSTSNKLLHGRGLPGTHDLQLLQLVLDKVKNHQPVTIPVYDKLAFGGKGDRSPEEGWPKYTDIDVLLVEGWFNGYKPITAEMVAKRYSELPASCGTKTYPLEDIQEINRNLGAYTCIWDQFDFFVNFETEDVNNVYIWRLEQEHDLIRKRGTGMTDEQVRRFIDRYMTMYEIFYRDICAGGPLEEGNNLNVKIDLLRRVLLSERR